MEKRISQKQYQKARKIIDLANKQSAEWRATRLRPIIKKYTETYWKKVDHSADGHYYYVKEHDDQTLHVISFISKKNGMVDIHKHWLSGDRIDDFLGDMVKGEERFSDCDDNVESCQCPQYDHSHYKEQHTPLKRIRKATFEKEVKRKILDEFRIGLKFK